MTKEKGNKRDRKRERERDGVCCFLSVCVRGVGRDIIEKMMDRAVIESILHTTL